MYHLKDPQGRLLTMTGWRHTDPDSDPRVWKSATLEDAKRHTTNAAENIVCGRHKNTSDDFTPDHKQEVIDVAASLTVCGQETPSENARLEAQTQNAIGLARSEKWTELRAAFEGMDFNTRLHAWSVMSAGGMDDIAFIQRCHHHVVDSILECFNIKRSQV